MRIEAFEELCGQKSLPDCLDVWKRELSVRDCPRGYDLCVERHGLEETVSVLHQKFYKWEDLAAERLCGAESLQTKKRDVRVIGTYYHRISNGGVQRVVSQLIPMWMEMGYRVILMTDEEPSADDYALPSGVTRVVLPSCFFVQPGEYKKRAQAITEAIRTYAIDIMVYHAFASNMLLWDLCAVKGNGVPFEVCCHSVFSFSLTKGQYHIFLKTPRVYALADRVLCLSKADEAYYRMVGIRAFYLPNPVQLTVSRENLAALDTKNVLWVGRISPEKGAMEAVLLFEEVLKSVPDARLHMVGSGDEGLTEELRAEIEKKGLKDHIILEGFHKEVDAFYGEAAVFLSTSAFEGFPCTAIESREHGIPGVYYELPYLELLRDGKGYRSVPQGDRLQAAKDVAELLRDDALRKEMGRKARESIEAFAAFDLKAAWRDALALAKEPAPAPEETRLAGEMLLRHIKAGLGPNRERISHAEQEKTREALQKLKEARAELRDVRKEQEEQEAYIQELLNSKSYRIGHALMAVPGKIKSVLKK